MHQKDYIDPSYLGGGLHQASPEVRHMYEALLPDIEAHSRAAAGADGPDTSAPMLQGTTNTASGLNAAGRGGRAASTSGSGKGSTGGGPMLEMQVGDAAGGNAPGQFPRPKRTQLQRGALEDVTVTTVKKTLVKKDLLKQMRQEIAARKHAALCRKPTGLMDRLFGVAAQAPPKGPRQRRKE